MASDVSLGDVEVPYLDVTPGDETTAGTLTVTAPDGTTSTPAVTAGTPTSGTVRLTATAVTYDQITRWVHGWTVTGTGAGAEDLVVYVVPQPTAGGPTWLPGRSRVANYVPGRTLSVDANTHELTFSSTTRPNGVMTDRLIADAASRVSGRAGTIATSLHDLASTVTAILAAVAVERGYPDKNNPAESLQRARDMERQAEQMLTELVTANQSEGETPVNPGANLMPVYSFPDPVPWGDSYLT